MQLSDLLVHRRSLWRSLDNDDRYWKCEYCLDAPWINMQLAQPLRHESPKRMSIFIFPNGSASGICGFMELAGMNIRTFVFFLFALPPGKGAELSQRSSHTSHSAPIYRGPWLDHIYHQSYKNLFIGACQVPGTDILAKPHRSNFQNRGKDTNCMHNTVWK